MLFKLQLLMCSLLLCTLLQAQQIQKIGGGEYIFPKMECINAFERQQIKTQLEVNKAKLYQEGKLSFPKKTRNVSLQWPLKQALGFNYNNYFGISNFVDHNVAYPNLLQDYNCGTRTYDVSSGYNHSGTDLFLWPFSWKMYRDEQVEIVAAAPGVIIYKSDGNPDSSCVTAGGTWNAVYIQHTDGSVAWYGHMKSGSLTSKPVGASVVVGEKIGLVGSSGNSTGPHLHFELYDVNNSLVDPFVGPCNTISTWWSNQRPYREPTINLVLTHKNLVPDFGTCPTTEKPNIVDTFVANDNLFLSSYFRDQTINSIDTNIILQPDNSVYQTWNFQSPDDYSASYWYFTSVIPPIPQLGNWKYIVKYNGQVAEHNFYVINNSIALDENSLVFTTNKYKNGAFINWLLKDESNILNYEIEKSSDGFNYKTIYSIENSNKSKYSYFDNSTLNETNFYRIKMIDYNQKFKFSNTVLLSNKNESNSLTISPNPCSNYILIKGLNSDSFYSIFDMFGRKVIEKSNESILDISQLNVGIYFIQAEGFSSKFQILR